MSRLAPAAWARQLLVCALLLGMAQLLHPATAVATHPLGRPSSCPAGHPAAPQPSGSGSRRLAASAAQPVHIPVYVHVLRSRTEGNVSTHRVRRQVTILNRAFAGKQSAYAARSPFVFTLVGIDRTTNGRWLRMDEGSVAERHAKQALHRGDPADLNLYIGLNRSGSLGWGTSPAAVSGAPRMDGVVIRRSSMAGGRTGHYSSGDAAVHETGHWLGLLHTFAGGCGKRGDLVGDTPAEARPSYTCPVRRNTCTAPGRDPVHNFMDYSYDSCMNQFTPGQVARMRGQWAKFRAGGD